MSNLLRLTCLFALTVAGPASAWGEPVQLAKSGQAKLPIVIGPDASERVQALAAELADYLGQISGAEFTVETGAKQGIVLRLDEKKPAVMDREDYLLRSTANSLLIQGASEDGLEDAVWDLLFRLGYRQFFPGSTWEVVPSQSDLAIDIDLQESPDYNFRRIWYGYGLWDYNGPAYRDWCRRNRMGGSLEVRSGHSYGGIIRAKQKEFDQHPEFYAQVNGKRDIRGQAKLCIGNPQLRQVVVQYAQEYFQQRPEEDCISMDPSDGGGWCECELCRQVGPPSDRALLLANQVAEAVNDPGNPDAPERFVGMYAYAFHSPPPSIRVHPNVLINAATAFIKGGSSIDEILSGWSAQGATLGIREYYSVNTWDRDLPGAARGSNLDYLARTIPHFHAQGARFLNSESSDNWGCNGLGYYFASRALWDLEQAEQQDAIVQDFLDKSFGPAQEPMRQFYVLIDGNNKNARLVYSDLLARMYRRLAEAYQLAETEGQRDRIRHLILYTRYVDLFDQYRNAEGSQRQAAYEQMIRHVYRIRETMMVHARALYRDVVSRDKRVSVPENARWSVPEDKNPWKSSRPFSEQEYRAFLRDGLERYQPVELDFEPREFSDSLVPASPLELKEVDRAQAQRGRGPRSWYTWLAEPGEIRLTITGGLIAHYRDRGNVKVQVWQLGGASQTGEQETLVAEDESVPPDGQPREVKIGLKEPGLYRIDLNDGKDLTQVEWPAGQPMTWKLSLEDHPRMFSGRWGLWFFVPPGTKRIGMYVHTAGGRLTRPDGEVAASFDDLPGEFVSAEVPAGMDGRLWRLDHMAGRACLLNVPPYAARTAAELLLPEEVVRDN